MQHLNSFVTRKYVCQTKLSLIYPAYFDQKNSDTLHNLLFDYAKLDGKILDQIEFVIVDDCSPIPITLPKVNLNMTLLRVGVDKYWNPGGAKNLGAVMASSKNILLTDLDYFFPEHTLRYLIGKTIPSKYIYKLYLKNLDGKIARPHPNTFLMQRARFLELYGYDEEFSDHYGYEDTMFYKWQRYHGSPILKLSKKYFKEERQVDRIKSYHNRVRELSHNREIEKRKRQEIYQYGAKGGHSRKMLRFPFEIVAEIEREPAHPISCDKNFAKNWPLRWIKNFIWR